MTDSDSCPKCGYSKKAAERAERAELIKKSAEEVATWPSWKLRAAYAHPDTVKRAEQREASLRALMESSGRQAPLFNTDQSF